MRSEQKGDFGSPWLFLIPLVLFAAIGGMIEYSYKHSPNSLGQRVDVCMRGYVNSQSAADTAHVDSMTPPEITWHFRSTSRTCGYYRWHGATDRVPR